MLLLGLVEFSAFQAMRLHVADEELSLELPRGKSWKWRSTSGYVEHIRARAI